MKIKSSFVLFTFLIAFREVYPCWGMESLYDQERNELDNTFSGVLKTPPHLPKLISPAKEREGIENDEKDLKSRVEKESNPKTLILEKYEGILTPNNDTANILRQPAEMISLENWESARLTAQKLLHVRKNILKGGAGLAAPQIGLSHPVFIYTPDRTSKNLTVVVNPSFEPLGQIIVEGHEACFSVPLHCARLKRWETIRVKYQNLEGSFIEKVIDGFEAKVFQHECDHVKGKLIIDHKGTEVLTFKDSKEFQDYMTEVFLEDSKRYKKVGPLN